MSKVRYLSLHHSCRERRPASATLKNTIIDQMKSISTSLRTFRLMTGLMLVFGLVLLPACDQDTTTTGDDDTIIDDDFDLGLGTTDADTVEVHLAEFSIDMPQSLPAGRTVFRVMNHGSVEHGFEIEGPDVQDSLTSNVQPGEEATLSVDLEPGSYEVWCPVADHAEQGMRTTLQVSAANTGGNM
jgi:hypothetical protein